MHFVLALDDELSTGVAVAISIVVTFIITLVVTALISSHHYQPVLQVSV